jgi:phosphoribosylaminoimidazole-succinocarboxamide synthase
MTMTSKKPTVLLESNLSAVKLFSRGKVRDVYEVGDKLLVIATDRLSAFDVVMREGIPDKGRVLNQLSRFWFDLIKGEIPHHFITDKVAEYPEPLRAFADQLEGRSMLVEKANPYPIECVVRGYLAGSGWKEYRKQGTVCGIKLPAGLHESSRLEDPIFTPSTKATVGHDENITFEQTIATIGAEAAETLRDLSLALYRKGREYGESRGIIIADTKFEWGLKDGKVILIDEVLTPDSSRFWPQSEYAAGKAQPSFDKQFVRDYLESLNWNKQPPPPSLPPEVVEKTSEKYREAFRLMTGASLS